MSSRWSDDPTVPTGATYDRGWQEMAAQGKDIHGEVAFLQRRLGPPGRTEGPGSSASRGDPKKILDAGCGTGRVAIELARRGYDVVGVDLDPRMLAEARKKAPDLRWIESDLSGLDLAALDLAALDLAALDLDGLNAAADSVAAPFGSRFDAVVLAGNVMIFVSPGTEAAVIARLAATLAPGGLLVAGFQVRPGGYGPDRLDADASAAGLVLASRYATWDDDPWPGAQADYQVSVHRLATDLP